MVDDFFNIVPLGARRASREGWLLHCCVVCGNLSPWSKLWSWYGSYKDLDASLPVKKFCSDKCKKHRLAVTIEMCAESREKEHCPAHGRGRAA